MLAVSGGLDSMVMTQLFIEAGFSFSVAHCNFQLRGEESEADQQFVMDFCKQRDIEFICKRFDTKAYAQAHGVSIQMAARDLRYEWFESLLEEGRFNALATAHHINDSLETILINWIHGSGFEGVAGIPVHHNKRVRPLLFATREQIAAYADRHRVKWREDQSNAATEYQRNLIRHTVIPVLKELNPSLEQTVQHGLNKIDSELKVLEYFMHEWEQQFVRQEADKMLISKKGLVSIPGASAVLWRVVRRWGFNYDTCASVIQALHGQPGKRFAGNAVHELVVDRDHLIVFPSDNPWEEVLVDRDDHKASLGCWVLETSELSDTAEVSSDLWKSTGRFEAVLDAGKLSFPLTWRTWHAGDAFHPLGMEHRKKVSDFLIDAKVSLADKQRVTVLTSSGDIVWLVGHRIDHRFRVTGDTQRARVFRVHPYFV